MRRAACLLALAALLVTHRDSAAQGAETGLIDPTRPLLVAGGARGDGAAGEGAAGEGAAGEGASAGEAHPASRLTLVRLTAGDAWAVLGGRRVRTGDPIDEQRVVAIDAAGVLVEDAAGARSVIGFGGLVRSPGSAPGVRYTNRNTE